MKSKYFEGILIWPGKQFRSIDRVTLVNNTSACLGLADCRFPRRRASKRASERASKRKFAGTRDSRAYDHRPRDPTIVAFILVVNPWQNKPRRLIQFRGVSTNFFHLVPRANPWRSQPPHVNGGRASHLFSATSRLYLPCLLTRARSSYSNRLSPLTVSSFCLFRAIGVKLRRLRVRPRLKALTGTPLDAGAVGDGIHFRFRTCGNPVTRGTGENDRIGSAARLRSYPHDSRDYDWWFAYEYFRFTLEMRR